MAADANGRIYACDPVRRAVLRWTPSTNEVKVVSTGNQDGSVSTPNWGAFGPDGSYSVSDSEPKCSGMAVHVMRRGKTELWTAATVDLPNGLAVSPDGRELWVLESTPGRLIRFPIAPDGSAGEREILAELSGAVPDGIALTTDGSAVIACYRPDMILRWRADLGLQVLAHDPEGKALACVFYGPQLDRIAVPNGGM